MKQMTAIIENDIFFPSSWLKACSKIIFRGAKGMVIPLIGDYTAINIASIYSLIDQKAIIVPLINDSTVNDKLGIALKENPLYDKLRDLNHAGIVLFTSGSSGEPKASVHDLDVLINKFKGGNKHITLGFMPFDHMGGLNTLLHTIENKGTFVICDDKSPKNICNLISKYNIDTLPVSPSFLNLLLLSGEYKNYNLSSLRTISYGSEVMPPSLLKRIKEIFPNINLYQTYGLTETGVFKIKSKEDSLFFKINNANTRIVNNILQIKSVYSMLGYINAESPFTEDGWYITGDVVEVEGEYIRIIGRDSKMINIGGDKCSPNEIENVIYKMDNIAKVTIFKENDIILGSKICADIQLVIPEDEGGFTLRLRKFLKDKVKPFMIPSKIIFSNTQLKGFKK